MENFNLLRLQEQHRSYAINYSMDMELEKLVDSVMTMMGCIQDDTVKACSISSVPKKHPKSQVQQVYTPRLVSIGPLHRGASSNLLPMEHIKWCCMFFLLHRTLHAKESLRKCIKAMLNIDEIVRATYNVYEIKFNNYELAKIMLLDGCFLLELLIGGSQKLNTQLKCRVDVSKVVAEIIKNEDVLSDLTMLENQVPLIILIQLAKQLFNPDVYKIEIMLPLFGYYSSRLKSSHNPAHILHLLHSFIGGEVRNLKDKSEPQHASLTIDHENHPNPKPKLKHCATTLEAAGVKIKALEVKNKAESESMASYIEEIRFDMKIKFDSKSDTLEIPQLHITETTEAKWKNFIAWELTKNEDDENDAIGSIFIWYALFFQGLLCSVHDINLLKKKNIIKVHHEGKKKKEFSNEELLILFRNLTEGVHHDDQIVNVPHFSNLFNNLNSYPTPLDWVKRVLRGIWDFLSKILTRFGQILKDMWSYCSPVVQKIEEILKKWYICIIMWHGCRCFGTRIWHICKNSLKILIREHITTRWKMIVILAAILTFALTFIQTFFPDPFH
ncbi:unnamed protein product [Lupinus luteus]|uniref:Uncharacterized protein n=1 Tax=Lupinus luteus TaxID=3873 RepID=A0AAV1VQW5_LUPLU